MQAADIGLLGRKHYWEGIPSDATEHCASDFRAAWLDGWNDARTDHMRLQAQDNRFRRGVFPEHRRTELQQLQRMAVDKEAP